MKRKQFFSLALLVLFSGIAFGQEMNIVNETISVSAQVHPSITFPGIVKTATVACGKNFKVDKSENKITITAVGHPAPCKLTVNEGTRTHKFNLVFVSGDATPEYDYSTGELLKNHVDQLNSGKQLPSSSVKDDGPESISMTGKTFRVGSLVVKTDDVREKVKQLMENFKDLSLAISLKASNYRQTIDVAMRLFNKDENVRIQLITKLHPDPENIQVRKYLNSLVRGNKLTEIKINKTDVVFVSELHKDPEGNYRGHVSFIQNYQVWTGDKVTSSGSTQQDQEFILQVYDDLLDNGKSVKNYRLFLGNLTVTQI